MLASSSLNSKTPCRGLLDRRDRKVCREYRARMASTEPWGRPGRQEPRGLLVRTEPLGRLGRPGRPEPLGLLVQTEPLGRPEPQEVKGTPGPPEWMELMVYLGLLGLMVLAGRGGRRAFREQMEPQVRTESRE